MSEDNEWLMYDKIGYERATALVEGIGSPSDFIQECEEENEMEVPTYSKLDLTKLKKVDSIGHNIASDIVDQIVLEIENERRR